MEVGGQWSQLVLSAAWPGKIPAKSNQGSTIRGEYTQTTRSAHLKYPLWVIGETVPLDPIRYLLHQATLTKHAVEGAIPNI